MAWYQSMSFKALVTFKKILGGGGGVIYGIIHIPEDK